MLAMKKSTKESTKWCPNLEGIRKHDFENLAKSNSAKRASDFPTS